jgi:uncharacterized protein YggE
MAEKNMTAKIIAWVLAVFLFFAFLTVSALMIILALQGLFKMPAEMDKISVTGEGVVRVAPDNAILSVGVVTESAKMADAQSENNAKIEAIKKALKAVGIADQDISTSRFQIYPQYSPGGCEIPLRESKPENGSATSATPESVIYPAPTACVTSGIVTSRVEHFLDIRIRDIKIAGKAIDAAAGAGATNIDTVRFVLEENHEKQVAKEARQKAVAEAKDKAKQISEAAKVRLGKMHLISEQINWGPIYVAAKTVAEKGTEISPGDLDVTVKVSVEFRIY